MDTSTDGNRPVAPEPTPVYGSGTVPADEIPAIKLYGAGALRVPAAPVVAFGDEVIVLAQRLAAAMHRAEGLGLAAPQIGVSTRVLVLASSATNGLSGGYPIVFVNPIMLEESPDTTVDLEGCLSFPRVWVQVARPNRVRVRAQQPDGSEFEVKAEGLYARALAHEIEHLDGKLLIDHAKSFKASQIKVKVAKLRRGLTLRAQGKRR